jgi:hypothetical protein
MPTARPSWNMRPCGSLDQKKKWVKRAKKRRAPRRWDQMLAALASVDLTPTRWPARRTCLVVYSKNASNGRCIGERSVSVTSDDELVVSLPRNWPHVSVSPTNRLGRMPRPGTHGSQPTSTTQFWAMALFWKPSSKPERQHRGLAGEGSEGDGYSSR